MSFNFKLKSLQSFKDPGLLNHELSAQIVEQFLGDSPRTDNPKLIAIGGGVASGKDKLHQYLLGTGSLSESYTLHDPDKVLHSLPGFIEQKKSSPREAYLKWDPTALFLANQILDRAVALRHDIHYLRTFALPDSFEVVKECATTFGYQVELHLVFASLETTLARAKSRATLTGRDVPADTVIQRHAQFASQFKPLVESFEHCSVWENEEEHSPPVKIADKQGGSLKALKPERLALYSGG